MRRLKALILSFAIAAVPAYLILQQRASAQAQALAPAPEAGVNESSDQELADVAAEAQQAAELNGAAATAQPNPAVLLNPMADRESVHIFPTTTLGGTLGLAAAATPLIYHNNGRVMVTATLYAIYWLPQTLKLQNGNPTSMSVAYRNLQTRQLQDYPAHGLDNNNTQYYQTIGGVTTYIQNVGSLGGVYLDTSPYPASGCNDSATPGNCLTDGQIRTEIKKVMTAKGWTGGPNKIFILYTSKGEGSCFGSSCAYTQYCAYHGYIPGTPNIIYANMPFGNPAACQIPNTPSPNGDPEADTATTASSHEVTEAITDPLLNAWFTSSGQEIGDICAYKYGANTWNGNKANQMWSGHFYELQSEYDNHTNSCVLVGPGPLQ